MHSIFYNKDYAMPAEPLRVAPTEMPSNITRIQSVARLNREGASYLVAGELDTALGIFLHALETLTHTDGFHAAPDIALAFWEKSFPFDRTAAQPNAQTASLLANTNKDDGSYFVYSNPLVFHPDIAFATDCTINCSAVVLFNMALAFHQKGRLADSRALLRGRKLYDMSLQMVAKMSCQMACSNIRVAAINNKAHIHFECSDVRDAKTTLHNLLVILSSKHTKPPFEDLEIEKFYMNILFLNATTMAGAA